MVVKFTATSRPIASDVSISPPPPSAHRWYANPLRMLDPMIMMQSRAHARGSMLQKGNRQDAGANETASATTVFSLGNNGIRNALSTIPRSRTLVSPPRPLPILAFGSRTTDDAGQSRPGTALIPTTRFRLLWRSPSLRSPACNRGGDDPDQSENPSGSGR